MGAVRVKGNGDLLQEENYHDTLKQLEQSSCYVKRYKRNESSSIGLRTYAQVLRIAGIGREPTQRLSGSLRSSDRIETPPFIRNSYTIKLKN